MRAPARIGQPARQCGGRADISIHVRCVKIANGDFHQGEKRLEKRSTVEHAHQDLEIVSFVLGPAATNTYLVGLEKDKIAVVIDPAWDGEMISREAARRGWRVQAIWLTHAHFDHFGGAAAIAKADAGVSVPVALHPEDMPLWRMQGGAQFFGIPAFDPGPEPSIELAHGDQLSLGEYTFEVRHTPGHTAGHVALLGEELRAMFCGDLIFNGSVGRTDLPGGNMQTLLNSIQAEVLVLHDDFVLLPGHGPVTSVGTERSVNPFLQNLG